MKKILMVCMAYYPYFTGGTEISTKLIVDGLHTSGEYNIDVLTHGYKDSLEVVNGVNIYRHYFGRMSDSLLDFCVNKEKKDNILDKIRHKIFDIKKDNQIINFYKEIFFKYDLVILSGCGMKMGRRSMWIAAKQAGVPFIQIIRDPVFVFLQNATANRYKILDEIYRYYSLKNIDNISYFVSPTQAMLDIHTKYKAKLKNQKIIPNSVDDEKCKQIEYNKKDNTVIYVGSISKNKGCHTLIAAFEKVAKKIPEIQLCLIGKVVDVEIPKVKNIIFKGYLPMEQAYEEIAKAKLLVLPSEYEEAFGRVLVEAVFNHTIAIGSDRGGIPEVFCGEEEYIFKSAKMEALADYIYKFMALDENGYNTHLDHLLNVFSRYRKEKHIDEWHKYIEWVLSDYYGSKKQ